MTNYTLVSILIFESIDSDPIEDTTFIDLIIDIKKENNMFVLTLDKDICEQSGKFFKYFDRWDSVIFKAHLYEYSIEQLYLSKFKQNEL